MFEPVNISDATQQRPAGLPRCKIRSFHQEIRHRRDGVKRIISRDNLPPPPSHHNRNGGITRTGTL